MYRNIKHQNRIISIPISINSSLILKENSKNTSMDENQYRFQLIQRII